MSFVTTVFNLGDLDGTGSTSPCPPWFLFPPLEEFIGQDPEIWVPGGWAFRWPPPGLHFPDSDTHA